MIKDRINLVKSRVDEIKYKNGIDRDITIIAVSKGHGAEAIVEARESAGQLVFGESRVQEFASKSGDIFYNDIDWHFIGNLQTNKVRKALDFFRVIHSVDSLRLALALDKEAKKRSTNLDIFIQVNTTGEVQKSGAFPNELEALLEAIIPLSNLRVIGLMTISMFTEDSVVIRKSFSSLRELRDRMSLSFGDAYSLDYLSMGMSGDYELALLEGASHLRIGSFIFGKRVYGKA